MSKEKSRFNILVKIISFGPLGFWSWCRSTSYIALVSATSVWVQHYGGIELHSRLKSVVGRKSWWEASGVLSPCCCLGFRSWWASPFLSSSSSSYDEKCRLFSGIADPYQLLTSALLLVTPHFLSHLANGFGFRIYELPPTLISSQKRLGQFEITVTPLFDLLLGWFTLMLFVASYKVDLLSE